MNDYDEQIVQAWQEAREDLGLEIETPFTFKAQDGSLRSAIVLIKGFGSPIGTVVISINDDFNALFAEARAAGYYCSALNPISYSKYNRKIFTETLDDWDWYGEEKVKPKWYTGASWSA